MNAAEIGAARQRLQEARGEWLARPAAETLETLGRVMELWRDPGSRVRVELEKQLPEVTGFHSAMVREALDHALEGWSASALRAFVEREGRDSPYPVTSVLLAGAIPMPTLLAILFPLALRSAVLAKPASADSVTAELVARSIRQVDPLLGGCVAIVPFPRDDHAAARAFFASDCVSATGSDETLGAIESYVGPNSHFVRHGHRVSVAALGSAAFRNRDRADTLAKALARDIARWDQLGCLSPVEIHTVGTDHAAVVDFAQHLADALEQLECVIPRGSVSMETAAAIAGERSEAEMRAALGHDVLVFASEGTAWTVTVEAAPALRPAPLHRFIRVIPTASPDALLAALEPLAAHLAAVALGGFENRQASLSRQLLRLGASRIAEPGTLQAPPLDWWRDNLHPLRSLSE